MEPKSEEEALTRYLFERIARDTTARALLRRSDEEQRAFGERALCLLLHRSPHEIRVHVANAMVSESERTIIQILLPDQPFLVDTLRIQLERLGLREMLLVHSPLAIEREEDGSAALLGASAPRAREAYLYAEVAAVAGTAQIESELLRVYRDTQRVVQDHGPMLERVQRHVMELQQISGANAATAERGRELATFLEWLAADHFVFMGYSYYSLRPGDELEMHLDAQSGLGLLRDTQSSRFREPLRGAEIPELIRSRAAEDRLIFFDKTRSESIIHRRGRMDSILVKTFDHSGRVNGFGKFIGLLTFQALHTRPSAVPILRKRLERMLAEFGHERGSHSYKAAVEAYDSLPLEFLFSFSMENVRSAVERVLHAAENRTVEIAVVQDPLARSFFVSVILPRDTYRENLREDVQDLLVRRYHVSHLDHRSSFVDEEAALIHFFCSCEQDVDLGVLAELEKDLLLRAMHWEARLETALRGRYRPDEAHYLARLYSGALPEAYRVEITPEQSQVDIENLERLRERGSGFELTFVRPQNPSDPLALRIYQYDRPYLTDLLPRLDRFGLRVVDAKLSEVRYPQASLWIASFAIDPRGSPLLERIPAVLEGLHAVLEGAVLDDALNQLVLGCGVCVRDAHLLRAYLAYAAQLGIVIEGRTADGSLLGYPAATRALIQLFGARFDPTLHAGTGEAREQAQQKALAALCEAREPIRTADVDATFELLSQLIRATVRTDYFCDHGDPSLIAFKLDPSRVERTPLPRPWMEVFVYSPEMRGVHLRAGPIARGGLRFSDRGTDLRSEILGLMKTQMVKNGLIVPRGAKGGFALEDRPAEPAALAEEVERQYARFIETLLRLTDNLCDGEVVPPAGVVRHDGDDPYLVVAPDKGTAHLSDCANRVAQRVGFWLGDAFASGGSCGYDHKAQGITARSGWICVQRHFLELGIDIVNEPFTMAGIGDMSGDVFGNALLLARGGRLLAAFNHQHVFVDPEPDPERTWLERRRLFGLKGSSWRDYDPTAISSGGGVFDRSAKAIVLSPQMCAVLDVQRELMTGEELVRAILRMPVDLLWNGGIGTYVKARAETHAQVGDRANDRVRVDACELRARVIGEGGNLGLTPQARVEYALAGGRINTDAVDNAGGVALSDLEVNFKVLIDGAAPQRPLAQDERGALLEHCVEEANGYVLGRCASQARCISMDALRAHQNPETLLHAATFLEQRAGLDPALEHLPSREQLRARTSGSGTHPSFTRPELCLLLGYTKLLAKRELAGSDLVDHPLFRSVLVSYFPDPLRQLFGDVIESHPLRREITAGGLVNRVIDEAGVTLLPELSRSHDAGVAEILCAYAVMERMLDASPLRRAIEDQGLPEASRLRASLRVESCVRTAARAQLARKGRVVPELEEMTYGSGMVRGLRDCLRESAPPTLLEATQRRAQTWISAGFDPDLAREIEELPGVVHNLGVLALAQGTGCPLPRAVRVHTELGELARIHWILERMGDLDRRDGWERVAAETLILELLEFQRQLSAALLERPSPEAELLEGFRSRNRGALLCIEDAAQEIDVGDRRGLVPLAVLAQLIRRLVS